MQKDAPKGRRVYVGNLDWSVAWQDLKDHMREAGNVVYADVFRQGGRSKGCGIVEYETPEEAAKAIKDLNDTELSGRAIFVREDREDYETSGKGKGAAFPREPREPKPARDFTAAPRAPKPAPTSTSSPTATSSPAAASFPSEPATPSRKLFINNLGWGVTWQNLKDAFAPYGTVVRADVVSDASGRSKGIGTVTFETEEQAAAAIQGLNGQDLKGRVIYVQFDKFEK
jgi:RNA recognition motif-containing protein